MRHCVFSGCERVPRGLQDLCHSHLAQFSRTGRTWEIRDRARRLSEDEMDGALLLIARGAKPEDVAQLLGLEGEYRQLRRQLIAFSHDGYLDALRAAELQPHGTRGRYGAGCRCDDCRLSQADYARGQSGSKLPSGAFARASKADEQEQDWRERELYRPLDERRYVQSLEGARRHRQEWTGPELEIAAREDLTSWQVAEMIGRTIHAVRHIRTRLKVDPRVMKPASLVKHQPTAR